MGWVKQQLETSKGAEHIGALIAQHTPKIEFQDTGELFRQYDVCILSEIAQSLVPEFVVAKLTDAQNPERTGTAQRLYDAAKPFFSHTSCWYLPNFELFEGDFEQGEYTILEYTASLNTESEHPDIQRFLEWYVSGQKEHNKLRIQEAGWTPIVENGFLWDASAYIQQKEAQGFFYFKTSTEEEFADMLHSTKKFK